MSLGLALGVGSALLGGMGGSSDTQSSTTTVPQWMMPFLTGPNGVLTAAQDEFAQGPANFFEGDLVADLNLDQLGGINQIRDVAGSAVIPDAASDLATKTLEGEFLGAAPFMDAFGDDIVDAVSSRFGRAGRSGSALEATAITNELGDVASRLFTDERNKQMQTLGLAPQVESLRSAPGRSLLDIGNILQGQEQKEIGADFERFMFEQNAPMQNIRDFASIVFGANPGSTTTTDLNRNPLAGALGGGLAGLSVGGQLGLFG